MTTKKTKTAMGMAALACVACCAPLIATPLIAVFAAGGAGLAVSGKIAIGLAVLAVAGVVLYSRTRKQKSIQSPAIASQASGCGCAPKSGCNSGNSCDVGEPSVSSRLKDRIRSWC